MLCGFKYLANFIQQTTPDADAWVLKVNQLCILFGWRKRTNLKVNALSN